MNTVFIGIDPGAQGAIAALTHEDFTQIWDIDGSVFDAIDVLCELKELFGIDYKLKAVLEHAIVMPRQGSVSSFKFGANWGCLRGALIALKIPIVSEPRPAQWKKAIFGTSTQKKDKKQLKNEARDMARKLYPEAADYFKRVKDDGRAEALLLAHYGRVLDKTESEG